MAFCHFPRAADWHWLLPLDGFYHIPMMLSGTVAVALTAFVCYKCCRTEEIDKLRLLVVSGVLTIVQILLVYSYYVHSDWDVQQVTGVAKAMAEGGTVEDYRGYFQWTPNNLFLSRIVAAVFFLTGPLWGAKVTLFPLLALQCIGAGVTALMLTQTAMHIWRKKVYAIITYVLYTALVWMSPWWSIPYSDIWGLMVAVTILWLATTLPFRRHWLKIFIVAAATAVGYYIRPQVVFVALAMLFVLILKAFCERRFPTSMHKKAGIAVAGIAAGVIMVHVAMIGCPLHLHTSKGFGPTHYLMMGANYQSIGIYSAQDVDFSRSYPKKKERARAEMRETVKRYSDLGVSGTLLLWGRKNLLNFSDGTFYWGREGIFYKEVPERSGVLAKVTRNIFYNRDGYGRYYVAWSVVVTSLFLGIIVFALFAALPLKRERLGMDDSSLFVVETVMVALLMLIAFHTLCEARSRYLFSFTPLFVIVAVEGIRRINLSFQAH
ncbi:MAG: hypothetical protein IJU81_08035 [Bacteroidales bacterium]|nr:hypothetical protein [Bacteroidales bacterium]